MDSFLHSRHHVAAVDFPGMQESAVASADRSHGTANARRVKV
jgi:hypothetical protein